MDSEKMNVLMISIDALRADHVGIYGYNKNTTPNIDNFARNSYIFRNAYTMVPMTHPSLFTFMTGRTPFESRIISNTDIGPSYNNKTLASILSEYGYDTSAFVANEAVLSQGFNTFKFQLFKSYYIDEQGRELYIQNKESDYEAFMHRAIQSIGQNKNKPFFTWIHLMDNHAPYYPEEELRCKFNLKYCVETKKSSAELENLRAEYQMCQATVPKERVELMKALYDGGISSADTIVGKILEELRIKGVDKKTIVIIYADHGEGFDHNYYFSHREVLYNSAIQIPLIIKDPRKVISKRIDREVQNADVLPSILDLLNIPYERNSYTGRSFASSFYPFPVSLVPGKQDKFHYFVNSSWTKFAISNGRYKYIYSLPQSCLNNNQIEELYDIKEDRNESHNLLGKNAILAKELKQALLKYLARYNLPPSINEPSKSLNSTPKSNTEDSIRLEEMKSMGY
ncbi:MAG: sulfatase [Candidatus Levybacteria bacterium]|nr:sulfatase [Candidatus Levybacteria bacterium]